MRREFSDPTISARRKQRGSYYRTHSHAAEPADESYTSGKPGAPRDSGSRTAGAQPLETYAATTTQAHWFGPDRTPLFGDTFVIEVWPTDIWVNNTRLPIVHRGQDGLLIAREGPMIEVELRPSTGRWYLRGGKGDADGTMVRR